MAAAALPPPEDDPLYDKYLAFEPIAALASVVFTATEEDRLPFHAFATLANGKVRGHNARDLADAMSNMLRYALAIEEDRVDDLYAQHFVTLRDRLQQLDAVVGEDENEKAKSAYNLVRKFLRDDSADLYGWYLLSQAKILPMTYATDDASRGRMNQQPLENRLVTTNSLEEILNTWEGAGKTVLEWMEKFRDNSHTDLGPRMLALPEFDQKAWKLVNNVIAFYRAYLLMALKVLFLYMDAKEAPPPTVAATLPLWGDAGNPAPWTLLETEKLNASDGTVAMFIMKFERLVRTLDVEKQVMNQTLTDFTGKYSGIYEMFPHARIAMLQPNLFVLQLDARPVSTTVHIRYDYVAQKLIEVADAYINEVTQSYREQLEKVVSPETAKAFVAWIREQQIGTGSGNNKFFGVIRVDDRDINLRPLFTTAQLGYIKLAL